MNAVLIFIKRCDIWWNTLIKFSKETGNNFAKIIKNKKTQSNNRDGAFFTCRYWLQWRTQNLGNT